jgi:phosphoserine phosphatase
MLSIVGYPVAVNPDRRLALLARAYHWPTLSLAA